MMLTKTVGLVVVANLFAAIPATAQSSANVPRNPGAIGYLAVEGTLLKQAYQLAAD